MNESITYIVDRAVTLAKGPDGATLASMGRDIYGWYVQHGNGSYIYAPTEEETRELFVFVARETLATNGHQPAMVTDEQLSQIVDVVGGM